MHTHAPCAVDGSGGDERDGAFDFVVMVVGVGVGLALILAFGTVLATNRKLRRKVGLCFSCGRCGCGVDPIFSYPEVRVRVGLGLDLLLPRGVKSRGPHTALHVHHP